MTAQRADVFRYVYDRTRCGRWSVLDSLTGGTLTIHDSEQQAIRAALQANEQARQGACFSATSFKLLGLL
jgi:hypothetical protein